MVTALLAVMLLARASDAESLCGDLQALRTEAERDRFTQTVQEETSWYRKAAKAAECLQESPEVIDSLWLHYAEGLSFDQLSEAVDFVEGRLQRIRSSQGANHPREVHYLWFETYALRFADVPRAEQAALRALRILRQAYGDASPDVAEAHRRMGLLYDAAGRVEESLQSLELAIRSAELAGRGARSQLYSALRAKQMILHDVEGDEVQIPKLRERSLALYEDLSAEGWLPDVSDW